MSNQYTLKISAEKAKEMPMVDLAFLVLKEANSPYYYRDLMQEIAQIKGFTEDQVMDVIAQLYTEINVDGRFACVGNNLWGLKRWYPVDNKSDDGMGSAKRPKIINDDDDDLEEDVFPEEEDAFISDDEDFDSYDEDREDVDADDEDGEFYGEDEDSEDTEEIDEDLDEDEEEEFDDSDPIEEEDDLR
ncbi:DNA-directed RNA polymerase subunit delta [Paenibacillus senegalensis]|uniref:DNA-directed RNA polymerase subunit delta n=1 Tax=Paenibacillus senegalensis TaxID=1465766 RepID=UPI000475352F|nr:DNA-directed RNA polymerase subunit delta [Paenibacillus senegalensis]